MRNGMVELISMTYDDERKMYLLLDISGVLVIGGEANHELIEYLVSECPADRIALLTNLDANAGDILTRRYGIPEFYDEIISAGETGYEKPNPKIFEAALARLNAKAEDCIFVDDTEESVETAHSLGMKVILYRDFVSFRAELESLIEYRQVQ